MLLALLALGACRCGEPAPERAWEVGAPLDELPRAAPGSLADFVPGGPPLFVLVERPDEVLRLAHGEARLLRAFDPLLLAGLAVSDAGATARALRQRLNDLSRKPFPEASLEVFLDGPLALCAREGPRGSTDFLVVKRLSAAAKASWEMAQMLQAVSPTLREVRVERYRGVPLRKVLVDDRRRVTYFLLRDLLVGGTSDEWVKESLDLALGGEAPKASGQVAVKAALREEKGAPLWAVVDTDALRAEPGRPGAANLALAQTSWARLSLHPGKGLFLTVAPSGARLPEPASRSALSRFAPKSTLAALSRNLDLGEALRSLFAPEIPAGPQAAEIGKLRDRLLSELGPTLGAEAFWYCDGIEAEGEHPVARHVVGLALKDPPRAARALPALLPSLLAAPLETEHEGGRDIVCGASALCVCLAGDTLLVANRAAAIKAALAVADGHSPGLGLSAAALRTADLVWADNPDIAAALSHSLTLLSGHGAEPHEGALAYWSAKAIRTAYLKTPGPLVQA